VLAVLAVREHGTALAAAAAGVALVIAPLGSSAAWAAEAAGIF